MECIFMILRYLDINKIKVIYMNLNRRYWNEKQAQWNSTLEDNRWSNQWNIKHMDLELMKLFWSWNIKWKQ